MSPSKFLFAMLTMFSLCLARQARAADYCIQLYRTENTQVKDAIEDCVAAGGEFVSCKAEPEISDMATTAAADYYACESFGIQEGHDLPALPSAGPGGIAEICELVNEDDDTVSLQCTANLKAPSITFPWLKKGVPPVEALLRLDPWLKPKQQV